MATKRPIAQCNLLSVHAWQPRTTEAVSAYQPDQPRVLEPSSFKVSLMGRLFVRSSGNETRCGPVQKACSRHSPSILALSAAPALSNDAELGRTLITSIDLLFQALSQMREDCIVEEHGMKTIPLFTIEPRFVVPDVLYTRIRVVNRLIDGWLAEAKDRDNRDRVAHVSGKGVHIDDIVHAINSCGVKFQAWEEEKKEEFFLITWKRLRVVAEDVADET
ncbi:hypothetical protein MTO96_043089 [Rhipicephalus appendiculatus]